MSWVLLKQQRSSHGCVLRLVVQQTFEFVKFLLVIVLEIPNELDCFEAFFLVNLKVGLRLCSCIWTKQFHRFDLLLQGVVL